jgi:hypothetical protein
LRPTTAGRTLDVTDTGEAGIDLANIHEPTTAVDLSGVTIKAVTDGVTLVNDAITAAKFDESTAFPLKAADTGATIVARAGDAMTLSADYDHAKDDVLTPLAVVDGNVDAVLTDTGTTLDAALATVDGILDDLHGTDLPAVKTETAAIKAKTDNLPTDPADQSAVEAAITAATSPLATTAALAVVDGIVDDLHSTDLPAVKADTAAILTDTGTTLDGKIDTLDTVADGITTRLNLVIGTGAISETLTITSNTGTPLQDVDVWLTSDIAGTTIVARSLTSPSGLVTFRLDAGTYYVWKQKSGYTFTNPEVLTV